MKKYKEELNRRQQAIMQEGTGEVVQLKQPKFDPPYVTTREVISVQRLSHTN